MLAERKKSKKWVLNPKSSEWSKDNNKFGQKILERMGWTPGQGLGAQNQGSAESIRIPYKNDNKGFGFKKVQEEWLTQQSDFSNLLAKLGGAVGEVDEESSSSAPKSLELKSKQSRARVHYHKFTRGKDISRYSMKDLAGILGPAMNKTNKEAYVEPSNMITGGNIDNYFRSKISSHVAAQGKLNLSENNCLSDENVDLIDGFNQDDNDQNDVDSLVSDKELCKKSTKRKRNKSSEKHLPEVEKEFKIKKRKKKPVDDSNIAQGDANSSLNQCNKSEKSGSFGESNDVKESIRISFLVNQEHQNTFTSSKSSNILENNVMHVKKIKAKKRKDLQ